MGWQDCPPNPLQHNKSKLTLAVYAEDGADNELKARRRCVAKYGNDPDLHQPWMDNWLAAKGSHKLQE